MKYLSALLLLLISVEQAGAVTLFEDDFDSYQGSIDFRNGITSGTSDWYAGQFQPNIRPTLANVGVMGSAGLVFGSGNVAWFLDDAGILINVNTVGYDEALLSFQWRTIGASVGESFYAGYYAGNLDQDFGPNNVAPFYWSHGNQWFTNQWNIIDRGTALWGGRSVMNYALPGNVESLWLAFWFDNNYIGGWDCDYAVLDNVSVRAGRDQPVPEPATLALLSFGLVGAAVRQRRVFVQSTARQRPRRETR